MNIRLESYTKKQFGQFAADVRKAGVELTAADVSSAATHFDVPGRVVQALAEEVLARSHAATDQVAVATHTQRDQAEGGRMFLGAKTSRGAGVQALRFAAVDKPGDALATLPATDLVKMLRALQDRSRMAPPPVVLAALVQRGLVAQASTEAEARAPDRKQELPAAHQLVEEKQARLTGLEQEARAEQKQKGSSFRRFFSGSSSADVAKQIRETQQNIGAASTELRAARRALAALKRDIEVGAQPSETDQGFLRLTAEGANALLELQVRSARLGEVSAGAVLDEIGQIDKTIEARWQRFGAIREELFARGFVRDDPQVNNLALTLTNQPGEARDVVDRATVINNYLYEQKWQEYDRLAVVGAASALPGDIHDVKEALRATFLTMVGDGHGKSYATWHDAIAVCRIKGASAKEKYQRFDAVDAALSQVGWKRRGNAGCTIARGLAAMPGDPATLVQQHSTLDRALVARGRHGGTETGIAAMILMNAKGTPNEVADRFNQMFLGMVEHGWKKNADNYAVAAALTLLPGTLEEKLHLVDGMVARLQSEGFTKDFGPRAVSILGGSYADFAGTTSPTSSSGPQTSSGVGFSFTGALIGDLIDNRVLDFSGGFVAGGLIGGALEG